MTADGDGSLPRCRAIELNVWECSPLCPKARFRVVDFRRVAVAVEAGHEAIRADGLPLPYTS